MNRRCMLLGALSVAGFGLPGIAKAQLLEKKIIVVGEQGVGKSALVMRCVTNTFLDEFAPTIADSYRKQMDINGKNTLLDIADTLGDPAQDMERQASYPQTAIFLLCFDIARPATFNKITSRWLPEIRRLRPASPWLLVGNKSDLRGTPAGTMAVDAAKAQSLARSLGAIGYRECSALAGKGVIEVFETAGATPV